MKNITAQRTDSLAVMRKMFWRMNEMSNSDLWQKVYSTDPSATKGYKGVGGFAGTAINTLYPIHEATKLFGPLGSGWNVEIVEDVMETGAPIYLEIEGVNTHVCDEKTHTLRVEITASYNGESLKTTQYGHTPYVTRNKYGLVTDHEYKKKTLSDAIKKALTLWGFSADIFMGEFDDHEYQLGVKEKLAIEQAEDKDSEMIKQAREYDEWAVKQVPMLKQAVTLNELEGLYTAAYRKANRKGDKKFIKAITKAKDSRKEELMLEPEDLPS